jgi:hypothetical protein
MKPSWLYNSNSKKQPQKNMNPEGLSEANITTTTESCTMKVRRRVPIAIGMCASIAGDTGNKKDCIPK